MFQAYADISSLESVALTATMVMPALLLQKPHPKSKAKEHTLYLNHRLKQWMDGDINGLLDEGRAIQKRLVRQSKQRSSDDTVRVFAKLMMQGKVTVHTMHQVFEDNDAYGVILVDATNAFNCLNRQTALINIKHLCPALSKVLTNTYREHIPLFID
jgi:hypothetical protein